MSSETVDGLWALAVCLGALSAAVAVGCIAAHFLLDEYGYWKRWRR